MYQIADSGALLVAISMSDPQPTVIKFSVDEGRCWHEYKFIQNASEAIILTGLLTEPENRAIVVMVWGYHPTKKTWTVFAIDFAKAIPRICQYGQKELMICFSGTAASVKLLPNQIFLSLFSGFLISYHYRFFLL